MMKSASEALVARYKPQLITSNQVMDHGKRGHDRILNVLQCTIKHSIQAIGVGWLNGKPVTLVLRPAPPNTGIVFRRVDLNPLVNLKVELPYIQATLLQTSIVKGGVAIHGIEHLLSALSGLGVDNIYIDIDNDEVPIMDGSTEPFVFLIQSVGLKSQQAVKRFLALKQTVHCNINGSWMIAEPDHSFHLTAFINSAQGIHEDDQYHLTISESIYAKSLSRAREGIAHLPKSQWRYQNEPMRHHIIDMIGDFSTFGYIMLGRFKSYNPSHILNRHFINYLALHPQCWEKVASPLKQQAVSETIYY